MLKICKVINKLSNLIIIFQKRILLKNNGSIIHKIKGCHVHFILTMNTLKMMKFNAYNYCSYISITIFLQKYLNLCSATKK